jgi:predicted RNA-binding protein
METLENLWAVHIWEVMGEELNFEGKIRNFRKKHHKV